jgi:hypothetical protein
MVTGAASRDKLPESPFEAPEPAKVSRPQGGEVLNEELRQRSLMGGRLVACMQMPAKPTLGVARGLFEVSGRGNRTRSDSWLPVRKRLPCQDLYASDEPRLVFL